MLIALVDWYVEHTYRIIVGQMVFFVVIAFWAWKERGRTHFFTEVAMFMTAMFAFVVREQWAFALMSVAVWAHIALIVREILIKGNTE